MKKIAVVILNWNGVQLLEQFLPSVVQFSPEAVIYVADNASTDDSVAFVKANFPTVRIIQNSTNYGFAQGYNEALQHIDADIYALVNSDIEVTANWLQPILNTFEKDRDTAIIQPKLLDFKNKDYFEYAGAAGGFIDKYGYPYCRGRVFDTVEKDLGQYDNNCEISWASGACFFIRSSVYKELGGFDEIFFAHQEEIDLCWRATNKGYKIKYQHDSTVYHVGGATLQQGNPKKTYLNFRNSLLMLSKNLPKNKLFPILFTRMILDGLAGIQFILQGKAAHFTAILKAHYSFYTLLSVTYKKRSNFQSETYYSTKSIVYQYYVNSGKIFVK
ncbi:glycosyltransferase family 2 protein [Flavobacterium sp. F-380]|uniref:Glycosyltransferase family 2 protein n=1 Tax=Flavobacterium kayseriense TaxID=2764714 RepID=A0ABR7J907_9FLAO|nr:glycosyltransferase family 2 protein [Flavobacterium kayseriense]MBC5841966.1 glycosyltransferase family 2 protein [Flavobacterium kayseriense]MBC5848495.1 glycosyltransferase family 2 protein [Flavobacterium kayseriense]MBU0941985.1 glycosyltransferase family 2 protein [Bacteroidota bacterium]